MKGSDAPHERPEPGPRRRRGGGRRNGTCPFFLDRRGQDPALAWRVTLTAARRWGNPSSFHDGQSWSVSKHVEVTSHRTHPRPDPTSPEVLQSPGCPRGPTAPLPGRRAQAARSWRECEVWRARRSPELRACQPRPRPSRPAPSPGRSAPRSLLRAAIGSHRPATVLRAEA